MKVVILHGSPRRKGNTAQLVERYMEGLNHHEEPVDISYYDVSHMSIKGCTSCYACQSGKGNPCAISDDMHAIYDALVPADVLVMASPVFYYSITAQLKAALDRTFAIIPAFHGKRLVFLSTYGAATKEGANIEGIKTMLQMACHDSGMELAQFYSTSTMHHPVGENPVALSEVYELGKAL